MRIVSVETTCPACGTDLDVQLIDRGSETLSESEERRRKWLDAIGHAELHEAENKNESPGNPQ